MRNALKNISFKLASFYFFYFSIIAIHIIFLPKILELEGFSGKEIGIIYAAAPLVRFVIPFLFIKGLELNTKIFNFALTLLSISALAFFIAIDNFWLLLIVNIFLGISLALILPYVEVIALTHIGKERYGKIRLYGSVGFILIALLLVEVLTSSYVAIAFLSVVAFSTTIFGYLLNSNDVQATSHESKLNIPILNDWRLWLGLMLMQVGFGPFYNFFTIYETAHGVSLDTTVLLWSFGVVVEIVMLYFQSPIMKLNLLHVLQFTVIFTSLRWFILYMYPSELILVYISQSIHALSFALFHSAAISYLYSIYENKKLAQQFFFGVCYGMGGFIGAISSGYMYDYDSSLLFLYASVVALLSFWFLLLHAKRIKALHVQS
jgi:PPP family 3-phenylpropionic acid transporter